MPAPVAVGAHARSVERGRHCPVGCVALDLPRRDHRGEGRCMGIGGDGGAQGLTALSGPPERRRNGGVAALHAAGLGGDRRTLPAREIAYPQGTARSIRTRPAGCALRDLVGPVLLGVGRRTADPISQPIFFKAAFFARSQTIRASTLRGTGPRWRPLCSPRWGIDRSGTALTSPAPSSRS